MISQLNVSNNNQKEDTTCVQMELARASQQRQRVIVFCHQPLHPDSCTGTTLAWTFKEVLAC